MVRSAKMQASLSSTATDGRSPGPLARPRASIAKSLRTCTAAFSYCYLKTALISPQVDFSTGVVTPEPRV
jgi:hypothetical protein